MFSFKKIISLSFLSLTCLACQNDPDFPNEPIISVESLTRVYDGFNSDNIILKLRFQDGNGDLGIAPSERTTPRPLRPSTSNQPFHRYFYTFNGSGQAIDSTFNKFSDNIFITTYRRNALGVFELVPFPDPTFTFTGSFPLLYEGNRQTPMEGIIQYTMRATPPLFKKGDVLRLDIQIADRSKTLSNIVSDTLTLKVE